MISPIVGQVFDPDAVARSECSYCNAKSASEMAPTSSHLSTFPFCAHLKWRYAVLRLFQQLFGELRMKLMARTISHDMADDFATSQGKIANDIE